MVKVFFAAPEDVVSVGRNKSYPVKDGVFAVDDQDDSQALQAQGYRQVAAPAPAKKGKQPEDPPPPDPNPAGGGGNPEENQPKND